MTERPSGRISIKLNGQQIEKKQEREENQQRKVFRQPEPFQANPLLTQEGPVETIEPIEENAMDRLLEMREKRKAAPVQTRPRRESIYDVPPMAQTEEDEGEGSKGYWASRFTFRNQPFTRFLTTAVSATAIGLGFGFFILNVFTQNDFSHSYRTVLDGTLHTLTANQEQAKGEKPAANAEPATTAPQLAANQTGPMNTAETNVALQLSEQSFMMAQIGAFQAKDAADSVIAQLTKEGYPHFLYRQDDKFYLFAATAPNRDELLGMASSFKKKGMDIFIKEVKLPGVEKSFMVKQAVGTNQPIGGWTAFFSTGLEMARTLSAWSSHAGNHAQTGPFPEVESNALKEKHRLFLEASRAVEPPADWQPLFSGMVNGMNQAITAEAKMAEAVALKKGDQAESYAWQVQTGILAYLENYAKWIQLAQ